MLKVIVDRTKWYRGKTAEFSRLRINSALASKSGHDDIEGKMCCLGFACLAAGWTAEDINDKAFPADVLNCNTQLVRPNSLQKLLLAVRQPTFKRYDLSDVCRRIGQINDFTGLSDREARLIELGKEAGIEFVFEG